MNESSSSGIGSSSSGGGGGGSGISSSISGGTSTHVQLQAPGSSLRLSRISARDAGNYTCVASNPLGEDRHQETLVIDMIDIHLLPLGTSYYSIGIGPGMMMLNEESGASSSGTPFTIPEHGWHRMTGIKMLIHVCNCIQSHFFASLLLMLSMIQPFLLAAVS